MSDTKKPEAPPLPPWLAWALGRIFKREAALTVGGIVVLLALGAGGAVYGQSVWKSGIDAGVEAKIEPLRREQADAAKRVESLERRLGRLEENQATAERTGAERFDVLYRTVLTGQPSRKAEELARPAFRADGGP